MIKYNHDYFFDKRIFVTGACGTVGKNLCKRLLNPEFKIKSLTGIDINESELFFLDQLGDKPTHAEFLLGDVRDKSSLIRMMAGMDIVFHCAALKHVSLGEKRPHEIVKTNIEGIENIIDAAIENHLETVIFTSSDKAVNPTNVMGTSKLMGERLITAANLYGGKHERLPVFASTRFGNVLGSSGSVIPIFHHQISNGGPITLTDSKMTRFIMTIEEAVDLVISSATCAKGGEVFVTKMPIIQIKDLAEVMIHELTKTQHEKKEDIKIVEIGSKPGEKLYEELMSREETKRSLELENFFVVLPAFRANYQHITYEYDTLVTEDVEHEYVSENGPFLNTSELSAFLINGNLL